MDKLQVLQQCTIEGKVVRLPDVQLACIDNFNVDAVSHVTSFYSAVIETDFKSAILDSYSFYFAVIENGLEATKGLDLNMDYISWGYSMGARQSTTNFCSTENLLTNQVHYTELGYSVWC